MQVQISIVLNSEEEFAIWVARQSLFYDDAAGAPIPETTPETTPETAPEPVAVEETAAPVVKKKRRRRTKAQIAEDEAAALAVAGGVVDNAAGPAVVESIVPQPDPVETEGEKTYALEDAMPILRAFINEHNSPPLVAKLKALGVERVNEIPPEKLSAFLAELVAETTAV